MKNIGFLHNMLPPQYCVTGPQWVKLKFWVDTLAVEWDFVYPRDFIPIGLWAKEMVKASTACVIYIHSSYLVQNVNYFTLNHDFDSAACFYMALCYLWPRLLYLWMGSNSIHWRVNSQVMLETAMATILLISVNYNCNNYLGFFYQQILRKLAHFLN